MKRLITAVIIATCLALCAAVWPQAATVEETPMPTPAPAVTAPEPPATGVKFEAEIDPPTEKEKDETSQSESPHEPINEPKPEAVEALAAPEVQPTPEPEPAPEPTPAQTAADLQPGDMVYVPGFGWKVKAPTMLNMQRTCTRTETKSASWAEPLHRQHKQGAVG